MSIQEDTVYELEHHIPLIDVRSADEFNTFHIPGAVHIPLSRILAGENVPEGSYLYCQSGSRSGMAQRELLKRGIHTKNIGGINAYPTK